MTSARRGRPVSARRLRALLGRFSSVRILVVGDFMLDQFIWGSVNRISPEAPVPVVRMTGEEQRAGGAGNVVSNVRSLGGRVRAAGIVGRDAGGRLLLEALRAAGGDVSGIVVSGGVSTTRKTRIIAHQQQVVRLDRENEGALDERTVRRIVAETLRQLPRHAAVVVSDYGKGVVTPALLDALAARHRRQPFLWLVDPKRANFSRYRRASLVKPNVQEASTASGIDIVDEASLCAAGDQLLALWESEAVLVSRGEEGMSLFRHSAPVRHFPTAAREVYDVTGAGDTAMAACALALAAGGTLEEAAVMANVAAGVAVAHVGTAAVDAVAVREAIERARGDGLCGA